MQKSSFESIKLKSYLEHVYKVPTLENARILKCQIQKMKNENFQLIQDIFLTTLLKLMDESQGLKKNEIKTVFLESVNLILEGSKLKKELPYRTLLMLTLKQIFDFNTNSCRKDLSEEFKLAVLDCFEISSRNLDCDVVESFMVEDNKIILGQCIFVCFEMIVNESYSKIRKKSVEALGSLLQIHDNADFNDVVLRDQISKLVFFILPQISTKLIKVCQEDTFKGSQLVQASTKVLGRFLCLIFEDYERKSQKKLITNEDFKNLMLKTSATEDQNDILNLKKTRTKSDYIKNLTRSQEWIDAAAKQIHPVLQLLRCLRGNEHKILRLELLILSHNLLEKCLPNMKISMSFLLENLLTFYDDPDDEIRSEATKSLENLPSKIPELSQEISELFRCHLITMPRVIMTGDESEQISNFRTLNSLVKLDQKFFSLNSRLLEQFMNILLSCCEIEVPSELLLYENLATNELDDKFYQMKSPWRKFKHLKNDQIVQKFTEICQSLSEFESAEIYINFLLDNMDSLEYLVLLIEMLKSEKLKVDKKLIEGIVDEFLDEDYWSMVIDPPVEITSKATKNEEWFKDSVPGLYESSIEVRLKDVSLSEEDPQKSHEMNLKTIKYNILSTCFVLQLIGLSSTILQSRFQIFILRSFHRVLQKAGNSNLLIRLAGLQSLEEISKSLGHSSIQELIDDNSETLLFNIHNSLKKEQNNNSLVEMLSVIFKFSTKSMVGYIDDIIESADEQITSQRFRKNVSSYLKLFQLYIRSVQKFENSNFDENHSNLVDWKEFYDQCLFELEKTPEIDEEQNEQENTKSSENQSEVAAEEEEKPEIPQQIQLIVRILKSSLQFFASTQSQDVILTHEIFIESLPILSNFENEFLPLIHEMWYPFTKQFQIQNLVVLQRSFRLLTLIVELAKDFVYKKSTQDVFPLINKFLINAIKTSDDGKFNLSYTQEFKLLKEILSGYGRILIELDIDDKELDKVVDILLKFEQSSSPLLIEACVESLKSVKKGNPGLLEFKRKIC